MRNRKKIRALALWGGILLPALVQGADSAVEDWNMKYQSTYVWQQKEAFTAPYAGPHSLTPVQEDSYTITATAFLGYRPWFGGELYLNPEIAQGMPLSNLAGFGGFTNGEIARSSGTVPKLYRARLFLRQTMGLGGSSEQVESAANQLAGFVDRRRLVLTLGNFSVSDIFDNNSYAHDPRSQFLNWMLMSHGAYDFSADARGYTRGLALEFYDDDWVLRAGRFLQPKEPNQQALDADIFKHYGDQLEIEHDFAPGGQPGKVRVLGYRNKAVMSRYHDALDVATQTGTTPDINAVRCCDRVKKGVGINVEQALTPDIGVFMRAMHADGQTETYAFAEVDDSFSAGFLGKGGAWQRSDDTVGLALVRNDLSRGHREYLQRGGVGFFIGDGRLNYQPEEIVETFYNIRCKQNLWISPDWQYIRNPAYNADRGPVNVISIRAHTDF